MINLDLVKPGDIVSWNGMKSRVRFVNLHRLEDMTTEVFGIGIKVLEGEDEYNGPMVCPGGFKNLKPWSESVQVGDIFEKQSGLRNRPRGQVLLVEGDQAVVRIIESAVDDQVGKLFINTVQDLNSDKFVKVVEKRIR